jgi:hypothetical protein
MMKMKRKWTAEEEQFLRENAKDMSMVEMGEKIGRTTRSVIERVRILDDAKKIVCPVCGLGFPPRARKQVFCSVGCASKGRKHREKKRFTRGIPSKESRMKLLVDAFGICSCMVRGCSYSITLDLHRHVRGRDGGEYIVGNMFAICPNHHAEIGRGFVDVEKASDCELVLTYREQRRVGRRTRRN